MNKTSNVTKTITLIATTVVALAGCSAARQEEHRTLPYDRPTLTVRNNTAMKVRTETGPAGEITVTLRSNTLGKRIDPAQWALTESTLDLGNPCQGYVGLCEGTYTVTAPPETNVQVTR